MLRLAVIQAHARGATDQARLALRRDGGTARVTIDRGWAQRNPRTLHLLHEEVDAWTRTGRLALALEEPGG